jgi:hypothetical protein
VLGAYHVAATHNGLLVRAAEVATADANAAD